MNEKGYAKPISIYECRHRKDQLKWKDTIQTKLNLLTKSEDFNP